MVIGIDEVGRGCWAGPLVAAAVGLRDKHTIIGLNDSKKLSSKRRQQLAIEIKQYTNVIGIGWVWPEEINQLGLTASVRLAVQRAFNEIGTANHRIIVDGNINFLEDIKNTKAVVGADGIIPAVSAASIIAKVARDTYMTKISHEYPEFGFDRHVGYGTKQHIEALKLYGVLPIHRIKYKPVMRHL